jgi:hypothetical protein
MEKSRCRTACKGGGEGLQREEKAHRKPSFRLSPEEILKLCRDSGHEMICAGWVLVVRDLMVGAGWPNAVLADKAGVSASFLSECLRMDKFFTLHVGRRIARAFGLKQSQVDQLAEKKVEAEDSL